MESLRIEALSFRYPAGGEPALRNASLEIPSGGIFGLLGPNGAGKTTLISILAGQLRGAAGRIEFGGEPLERGGSTDVYPSKGRRAPLASRR